MPGGPCTDYPLPMLRHRPLNFTALALAAIVSACSQQNADGISNPNPVVTDTGPEDAGQGSDVADVLDGEETGMDGGMDADATVTPEDLPNTPDLPPAMDGPALVACTTAGGSCVAVAPGTCPAPATIGSATVYSCGSGVGTECCLPGDAGTPMDVPIVIAMDVPPVDVGTDVQHDVRTDTGRDSGPTTTGAPQCLHAGSASEGWYSPSGTVLCLVACSTARAPACQRIGTAAQGWYTSSHFGCPPYSTLIVHDHTCM